ncbi:hypothetical protein DYU11_08355 [Fibrisoma montanum]|uniref:Uncharacterized protein n=1 Tax=Fibrisoma montanum TaxID=2305895 RepID=A0A418MES1_9BACT|nr:hypothetical protein [Fibrisoma montanum]RIV25309.1 hypothetical protein DYU11_08355 [Fibrisoma montanum]
MKPTLNTLHNLTVLFVFVGVVYSVLHGLLGQPWHRGVVSQMAFTYLAFVAAVAVASVVAHLLLSLLRGTNAKDDLIGYEVDDCVIV